MADLLLGIDIGTSACKAAVFTLDGQVAAQCSEEYEVFYPQPGWAEQNPDDWWKAVCASIQRIGAARNSFGGSPRSRNRRPKLVRDSYGP